MALEAETDQSEIKNYKCRFSDKVFSYLKQCKRITEKAVFSKWRAYFNKTCLNENIEPLYCKHIKSLNSANFKQLRLQFIKSELNVAEYQFLENKKMLEEKREVSEFAKHELHSFNFLLNDSMILISCNVTTVNEI